jgi:hypothetical protein
MPGSNTEPPSGQSSVEEFRRQCHTGAIALRVAAERLELLSRQPGRLYTSTAGLAIDAMSCAAQACQELMPVLLDADIERRTQ